MTIFGGQFKQPNTAGMNQPDTYLSNMMHAKMERTTKISMQLTVYVHVSKTTKQKTEDIC